MINRVRLLVSATLLLGAKVAPEPAGTERRDKRGENEPAEAAPPSKGSLIRGA